MPVAAAAILQRIADFLTVGTSPQASPEAGGEFSLHLAARQADEAGKSLPLDRQDLAAPGFDLPAASIEQTGEAIATPEQPALPNDALPSTTSILVAADTLPAVTVAMTDAPLPAAPVALPMQDVPTNDTAPHGPAQAAMPATVRQATPVAKQPTEQADVPPAPARGKAQPHAHAAKRKTPVEAAVKPVRQAPITTDAKTEDANADEAPVALPASDPIAATQEFVAQTDSSTQPEPTQSPVAVDAPPANAAPSINATPPATVVSADDVPPAPQPDAQTQPVRTDRHVTRAPLARPQSIHATVTTAQRANHDTAPTTDPLATASAPTLVAPTAADTDAVPPSVDIAAPIAAPIATAAAAPVPVLPAMLGSTEPATQQAPASVAVETSTDQSATTAPRPAIAQPAQSRSTAATVPAQPSALSIIATAPVTASAARPAGVSFIARPARPAPGRTQTSQPVETIAPEARTTTAAAPAAVDATQAGDRTALPMRATARQILAAQPEGAAAPCAHEAEAAVRTPAAEVAPTIAQHLMPAAHGSERILATAAPSPQASLSTEQAAALVETIQMLRSEAKSDAMTLAVDHGELGRITMRFDRTDHGVAVQIDSPDPSVTQLIANSAPALKASGDGVGMRFERQDTSSSGAGMSRDAPRQGAGQDRNPPSYAQSSRPRASGRRDGLFA